MAVIVDPAGLDPHHRRDEGREKRGLWDIAVKHLAVEHLAVEHGL